MASEQIEVVGLETGFEQLNEAINKLADGLGKTRTESDKTKSSTSSLSQSFGSLAIAWNQSIELATKLYNGLKQLANEMDRQSGVFNNLAGSITEADQRLNGMVSRFDLAQNRNRILAEGLGVTEHQFANLSVAANDWASRTGHDATEAIQQLSEALTNGSAPALRNFGIIVEDTTNKEDTQQQALAQLERMYGNTSSTVSSLSNVLSQNAAETDNLKSEMLQAIETSGNWATTLHELEHAFTGASNNSHTFTSALSDLAVGIQVDIRLFSAFIESLDAYSRNDMEATLSALHRATSYEEVTRAVYAERDAQVAANQATRDGAAAMNELAIAAAPITQRVMTDVRANIRTAEAHARRGGGSGTSFDAQAQAAQAEQFELVRRLNDEFGKSLQLNQQMLQIAGNVNMSYDARLESLRNQIALQTQQQAIEQEGLRIAQDQANIQKQFETDQATSARLRAQEAADLDKQKQAARDAEAAQLTRSNSIQQRYNSLVMMSTTALAQGFAMRKKGDKEATHEWLKNFAKQEGLLGLQELAMGIGTMFIPGKQPEAAGHFISSGIHFVAAAATGAGAAATKGHSSGGSGGGQSTSTGNVNATKPGNNSSDNSSLPPVTINVNGLIVGSAAQMGQTITGYLTSYQGRY